MKKLLVLLSLAALLFLFISCPDDTLPEDTIMFTLNGTVVELTKGLTSDGGVPVICRVTEGTTMLIIFGSDEEISGEQLNEYIGILIEGDSAGSFFNAVLYYYNESEVIMSIGTASGSIDELNAVGEYCTGTFSGTAVDEAENVYAITDGEFNIIRSADNSFDG